MGGFSYGDVNQPFSTLASAEIYDPATGMFTAAGNLITSRGGHTATLLQNGKVLITGGLSSGIIGANPSESVLSSAEIYDPSTGLFTAVANMTMSREEHTATLLTSGSVLIAGGFASFSSTLNSAELYDPASDSFAATGNMSTARAGQSAILLNDGTVLITGGYAYSSAGSVIPTYLLSSEIYTP